MSVRARGSYIKSYETLIINARVQIAQMQNVNRNLTDLLTKTYVVFVFVLVVVVLLNAVFIALSVPIRQRTVPIALIREVTLLVYGIRNPWHQPYRVH